MNVQKQSQIVGEVLSNNSWIIAFLGTAAAVVTFVTAGTRWALICVIVILGAFLGATYRTLLKTKRSSTETTPAASASPQQEKETTPHLQGSDAGPPQYEPIEPQSSESTQTIDGDSDESFDAAIEAAVEGNTAAVQTETDSWIGEASNEEERIRRRSFSLFLLVRSGKTTALDELRQLTNEHPDTWDYLQFYGLALDILGESQQAIGELSRRRASLGVADRAQAIINEARMRFKVSDTSTARELAQELATDDSQPANIRAEAYKIVADTLKPDDVLGAMGAYEQALMLDPTASKTRFDIAYLYGENNLRHLAMRHYSILKANNTANSIALNNLGVCLYNEGFPIRAIAQYREAADKGSALAAANLAHLYIDMGDEKSATAWIEEGRRLDPNQERVLSAADRLNKRKESEKDAYSGITNVVDAEREVIRDVLTEEQAYPIEGRWLSSDYGPLEFEAEVDRSIGTNKEESVKMALDTYPWHDRYHVTVTIGKTVSRTINGLGYFHQGALHLLLVSGRRAEDPAISHLVSQEGESGSHAGQAPAS